ncbi:MAG: chromatin-remodeling complex subunit ies6 [Caeruleum heppii]|nr:MAG: chromatin-remodeling complex subunit ies6 [Caeruleum heppii]
MPHPPPPNKKDESHELLLNNLSIAQIPKPFRNPSWKPPQRRNKNIKQILGESSRKEASILATQNNSGSSTPLPTGSHAATGGVSTPLAGAAGSTAAVNGGQPPNIAQAAANLSTLVLERNAQNINGVSSGPQATYSNIESAPSLHPAHSRHYCDITGLHAPYTDPKTRLRYHDKEVFAVVRTLGQGVAEKYLEARGAHVVLK